MGEKYMIKVLQEDVHDWIDKGGGNKQEAMKNSPTKSCEELKIASWDKKFHRYLNLHFIC